MWLKLTRKVVVKIKAITLWNPWAVLVWIAGHSNPEVAKLGKRIETRSWATKYRGPLAIHSAKNFPKEAEELCKTCPSFRFFREALIEAGVYLDGNVSLKRYMPCGMVMATCNLVNCVPITPEFVASLSEQEKAFGDYTIGRFAWILDDVKALDKLVPVKGAQRLWELDERILELAGVATMTAPERILGGRTWEEFPDPQG